jgi:hypothetical protein
MTRRRLSAGQWLILVWAVGGVVALLVEPLHRLAQVGLEAIRGGLTGLQAALLAVWTVIIVYTEGYRAFQQRFAPRLVARALHLVDHPRPLHVLLAPFYVMTLFHTTRRRLIASWVLVAGIVGVVIVVRQLDQPYRGIIDGGVALALAWGTAAILVHLVRGLAGKPMPVPPDLPDAPARKGESASAPAAQGRNVSSVM